MAVDISERLKAEVDVRSRTVDPKEDPPLTSQISRETSHPTFLSLMIIWPSEVSVSARYSAGLLLCSLKDTMSSRRWESHSPMASVTIAWISSGCLSHRCWYSS